MTVAMDTPISADAARQNRNPSAPPGFPAPQPQPSVNPHQQLQLHEQEDRRISFEINLTAWRRSATRYVERGFHMGAGVAAVIWTRRILAQMIQCLRHMGFVSTVSQLVFYIAAVYGQIRALKWLKTYLAQRVWPRLAVHPLWNSLPFVRWLTAALPVPQQPRAQLATNGPSNAQRPAPMMTATVANGAAQAAPIAEQFLAERQMLRSMGFLDDQQNWAMLCQSQGSMAHVIERLSLSHTTR